MLHHARFLPGEITVSVLQLCILVPVAQLTLHAGIAVSVLWILLRRALPPILIPLLPAGRLALFEPGGARFVCDWGWKRDNRHHI
jgi:hypothetical protein